MLDGYASDQQVQRVRPAYDDGPVDNPHRGAAVDDAGSARHGLRVPCDNDPRYIECFSDLVRRVGQRYDGRPALKSLDIAIGGSPSCVWPASRSVPTAGTRSEVIVT